jgi:hypothetical protein
LFVFVLYGFSDGNSCAAVGECQRHSPYRRIPSQSVFTQIPQTLHDAGSLASVSVFLINTRENVLEMVQRSPRLSTRRMASRMGVSSMQGWQNLHDEEFYPYHDQSVQHLEPGNRAQPMDLCH